MSTAPDEITKRESVARTAIKADFNTDGAEFGTALFVSHHLKEVKSGYWTKHLSTDLPDPRQVLDLLDLQSHWGGDEEIDIFDFTLPEQVTNYVLGVRFDGMGQVVEVAMES